MMKDKLKDRILEFVYRLYQKDREIIEQTTVLLAAGDYQSLISLMEKIDKNHRRNAGVLHFEVLGLAYQLSGEALIEVDFESALASYDQALAAFERGMHYATGAGEGWHFRGLFDAAQRRRERLLKKFGPQAG